MGKDHKEIKREFIKGLPKCEHHVHLEGCMSPELIFNLAAKNGIKLPNEPEYKSVETLNERYLHFTSLDDFLSFYFKGMEVLKTESDFADLAWHYFQIAKADGVHHAEAFFDPQVHQDRGIPLDVIVKGFEAGCKRAEKELGVTTKLIMCFLRHLPVESAVNLYEEVISSDHLEAERIHGFGWSSSEVGPPKDMFKDIYAKAKKLGIPLTAHAGEEGDSTYISTALDIGATRIDHGIHLADDPELMKHVAKEKVMLTVCPLSNVQLKCVKKVADLPIKEFLNEGVSFSINSDDPAYFGGYILDNYYAVDDAFNLSVKEWKTIADNSVKGSWITDSQKSELLTRISQHVSKYETLLA